MDNNRILFVHPLGYESVYAEADIARQANLMPPLGLASMAAYLEEKKIASDILDCFAHPDCFQKIRDYLRTYKPGFIGFTCTTSGFPDAARIAEMAKQETPGVKTVIGGAHPSALKEKSMLGSPAIDFAVVGEGEKPIEQLILSKGQDVGDIPGICHRENGDPEFNGGQKELVNLDELPFPAYEKLDGFPETYTLPIFNYPRRPNTSCISSRGCPYKCSYCDRSVFGSSFRYNSANYLYEHMRYLRDRWGIRHINFYDDQFTLHRGRVVELCTMLTDHPLGMTFNCAARAEHVDPELLELMKEAGCWMISLGIENGNQKLLSRHRQNADLDMVAAKVGEIKKAKIRIKGLFMLGLPGETEKTIQDTRDYARSLNLDDLNLAKFTPFPGSPAYENIREYGSFDEDFSRMDCMHFLFIPEGLTEDFLEEKFQEFYKDHFTRPRTMYNYVSMLWKSPDSWKRFLSSLPDFLKFAFKGSRIDESGTKQSRKWNSKSLGSDWQHRFFYMLIRRFGVGPAYGFLHLVTLWYVLLYPSVRRRIRPFLRHRFPQRSNFFREIADTYRLSLSFGKILIDRAAIGILGTEKFKMDFPEQEEFKKIIHEGHGAVLINSHAGSWQVTIAELERLDIPVSMLMQRDRQDVDRPYFVHQKKKSPYKSISPEKGPQAMLEMLGALKNGGVVGVMGDRAFGNDKNVVDVDFLGEKAWLPYSAYKLASASQAPCLILLTHKSGHMSYTVRLAGVIRVPENLGRGPEHFREYAQQYANALERFAMEHPWQFFNFYDMWEK